jgi:hypothetical protein
MCFYTAVATVKKKECIGSKYYHLADGVYIESNSQRAEDPCPMIRIAVKYGFPKKRLFMGFEDTLD